MVELLNSVAKACAHVRALINVPRRSARLRKDLRQWHQLCASMDVIEDSQLALDVALEATGGPEGSRYLHLYGALQALFIQQAAVKHLVEALGLTVPTIPRSRLTAMREIRNESVGHPSKSIKGKDRSYHFISRPFLQSDSFQILSFNEKGEQQVRNIQLHDLIHDQSQEVIHYLTKVATKLMAEDEQHRQEFSGKKLLELFPRNTLGTFSRLFWS